MAKFEFEDEGSRHMDAYSESAGARARRTRILRVLAPTPGARVLDVGSGPGHQAFEMASVVGPTGRVDGIDPADTAIDIARHRCTELDNVHFQVGEATKVPFSDSVLDAAMSSQTFEFVDDVPTALAEMYRVLRPGGRLLIHDTDWGAICWRSSDPGRMARIMKALEGAFTDSRLPQTLAERLTAAGFADVRAEPFVQLEIDYDPVGASAVLTKTIPSYVTSNGISQDEADAWAADLHEHGSRGEYFFSSTEYIFTGTRP